MDHLSYEERRRIVEEWMQENGVTRLERDSRLPTPPRKLTREERAAMADAANDPDIMPQEDAEDKE